MNVYVFDIGSICIHGKELLRQSTFHQNTGENLSLKQMFEISEKLILEQSDEIYGVSQIRWENSSWKQLSLVNDEEVISLSHTKVYVFSDSVLCLGKKNQNPESKFAWEEKLTWFKRSSQYRTFDTIDGEQMEYFPRSHYIAARPRSPNAYGQNGRTRTIPRTKSSSCRCSMTSYGELKTMKRNVLLIPHLCPYSQKDFQQDVGHSSALDQKQSGVLLTTKDHKENRTESLN